MLEGKKTYLTAIATFLIAVGYAINIFVETGNIEINAVIMAGISLALVFLRKGVNDPKYPGTGTGG